MGGGGTSFEIGFYSDSNGIPDVLKYISFVSVSSSIVDVGSGFGPVTFYSGDLGFPFEAVAGTRYWLSIYNGAPDAKWSWLKAEAAGNGFAQDFCNSLRCTGWEVSHEFDLAFELSGNEPTTTSEPTSMGLLGFSLACVGVIQRRYKRARARCPKVPLAECNPANDTAFQ